MAAATVVQYVAVRKDLLTIHKWSLGAVIAQACHACTAAIHVSRDDPFCQQYLHNLDTMHKIVLEVNDQDELLKLSSTLREAGITHHTWVEHPEEWTTCLATKPYLKNDVNKYFRKFKLFN